MNIPNKVIEIIDRLPVNVKGELYCAVINRINGCDMPCAEISDEASEVYENVMRVLEPILRRRRQQAEYRRRKKQERLGIGNRDEDASVKAEETAPLANSGNGKANEKAEPHDDSVDLSAVPRNRRQRRAFERCMRLMKKHSARKRQL